MKKKNIGLLILFVMSALIVLGPVWAKSPEQSPTIEEPPMLQENGDKQNALEKHMAQIGLVIPKGLQARLDAKRWVAWRLTDMKRVGDGSIISYVIQYLSITDNDRYFAGEEYRGHMLKAEAIFCHKHKELSHFRWFDGGMWHVRKLHKSDNKVVKRRV